MQPTQDKSSVGTVIAIVIVILIILLAGWFFFSNGRVEITKNKDGSVMMKAETSPNQAKSLETLEQETKTDDYNALNADINAL